MPTETTQDYLLLFRGTDWHHGLSPEQIQETMSAWKNWFQELSAAGKCQGGAPLQGEGKVVSAGAVSDGPFSETKEAIGGYFYLQVADEAEAVAIAQQCPALEHGLHVEVRSVAPSCPVQRYLNEVRERELVEA